MSTAPMSAAPMAAPAPAAAETPARAWWHDALRRFARDRWAVGATVVLVAMHLAAVGAPWIADHVLHQSPLRPRIMDRVSVHGSLRDVVSDDGLPLGPCASFPLGADALGRDVLT